MMFCGQRIIKQGATVLVHQHLCIEDLHEALMRPVGASVAQMMGTIGLASTCTKTRRLVDSCGSEHQKIWYAIFEIDFGYASTGSAVWKGGQAKDRFMVVHINHAIARTACRARHINFADLLLVFTYFYGCFRARSQQSTDSLQDSSLAVTLRIFDEGISAQQRNTYENNPEY